MSKVLNKKMLWGSFASLSLISFSCSQGIETKKDDRPNFLFMITDDQSYEALQYLNDIEVKTPNMDRLARSGMTFTQCFNQGSWSGAVCVASRTMLITGQNLYTAPNNQRYLPWGQKPDAPGTTEVKTWGQCFTEAGYETFLTGKWHNSDYAALKSFKQAKAIGLGMYETFDENHSKDKAYYRPNGKDWTPWEKRFTGHWKPRVKDIVYDENKIAKIGPKYTVEQHTSELYADQAIDFLFQQEKTEIPFFMYVSFNAPHDPRQSPREYVNMYPTGNIRIPENYLPEHPFDQGDHSIRDEILAPFPRTKEAVKLHRQEYYAIISHVDHEIGRILDALEKIGKADNTIIILTADHGLAVGHHGLMGKQNQYDHSIRMPFIISGPDIPKDHRSDAMIYMQSIYATSCELAGIDVPETVQFPSIGRALSGGDFEGQEYIFGGYLNYQRMIRSNAYKLIVYPHNMHIQLFDLEKDPGEMKNLVENPEYQEVIKKLFSALQKKQEELGDKLSLSAMDFGIN